MRAKQKSKIRALPVLWPEGDCAWEPKVKARMADMAPPESFFIGLLGLGMSLTSVMPPIILTPKNSQNYELKEI
jgi:hypothetical protein